ncbi:MAG TPA: DUF302 domain-containing protein [Rhizobiales bacterium]|nr:DUF302 domain-containing protein [Hyphomicrobiales bacterium]
MNIIRNLLALIGLLAVIGAAILGPKLAPLYEYKKAFDKFDPKAGQVYMEMADKLVKTGSPVAATVWKWKVNADLSFDDLDETIRSVAAENNIKDVGALPLSNQISAMTGKDYRKVKIYLYCNPLTAAKMLDFDDSYAAYLPCRVTVVEDKKGQLWIYTLNMDPMIYGGKRLPDELRKEAIGIKKKIMAIGKRAAEGDF